MTTDKLIEELLDESSGIAKLAADVQAAQQRHAEAMLATETARREETRALNYLNNAQKLFKDAVDKLYAAAPSNSDWGRAKSIAETNARNSQRQVSVVDAVRTADRSGKITG